MILSKGVDERDDNMLPNMGEMTVRRELKRSKQESALVSYQGPRGGSSFTKSGL
jgi:hypothetical protein